LDSAVVMLDSGFAAAGLAEPDLSVFWGAYLGTPDETTIAGRLGDVAAEIVDTRARLRAEHGWIMDTYLLRRDGPPERWDGAAVAGGGVEVAVAGSVGGQHAADDDDRGALDAGRVHLGGDVGEGAAQDRLGGLAGVGDHRRRAVGAVVGQQLRDDLVD